MPTQSLLKRQLKRFFGKDFSVPAEWEGFIAAVDRAYADFEVDRELIERSFEVSSQELLEANSEIRAIFQAIPDLVFRLDHEGTILSVKAGAGGEVPQQVLLGQRIQKCWLKLPGDGFSAVLRRVIDEQSMVSLEHSIYEIRLVPLLGDQVVAIARDITKRKSAEAKLEQLHKQLVDASREAGMAEIATNVLHNVGNVLTSVNVSASLVSEQITKSKCARLTRVAALLNEHAHDLPSFIASAQGGHLTAYLQELATELIGERDAAIAELSALCRNVEHIKEIVAMQQSYAKRGGVVDTVDIQGLVEDSLRMNEGAFNRHGVALSRDFQEVPPIQVDRHKVLQILVNVIRNATYACDEAQAEEKRVTVRVRKANGSVLISVIDTGVGIAKENLTRIFNHGFTTRPDGHGFGLHSSALAARELGGALHAESVGPGHGATFILTLPIKSPESLNAT